MNATLTANETLTAGDRCDRCGAQAYARVSLPSGGELLFCAHHRREYGPKLDGVAVKIYDETDRLRSTLPTAPVEER